MEKLITRLFQNPLLGIALAVILPAAGFFVQVELPFDTYRNHGAGVHLSAPRAVELAGREVYVAEGCQYCHTQAVRNLQAELTRFAGEDYGYFPGLEAAEFSYDSPALRGSQRLGPDLARLGGRLPASELRQLLMGRGGSELSQRLHNYSHLYESDYSETDALMLQWRIRAMMQAGAPLSDALQRSVPDEIVERSRGEALAAYLLSLGARQKNFAGSYFTK